jgi:sugar transport protein
MNLRTLEETGCCPARKQPLIQRPVIQGIEFSVGTAVASIAPSSSTHAVAIEKGHSTSRVSRYHYKYELDAAAGNARNQHSDTHHLFTTLRLRLVIMLPTRGLALRETFNVRLTLTVLLIAFSQFNFGFEVSVFSSTQAMAYFERQFGSWSPVADKYVLDPAWLALFNALPYIGFATGLLIGSYVSNRWGRRMCVFTMSAWALCAAAIIISARTRDHLLAGRVLNCTDLSPFLHPSDETSRHTNYHSQISTLEWSCPWSRSISLKSYPRGPGASWFPHIRSALL